MLDSGDCNAVCTVISGNYLPFARVLIDSVRRVDPDVRAYVLLVDEIDKAVAADESFTVVPVQDLRIPNFRSLAFKYDILELNTAVKASFFKYLFSHERVGRLIYFDPDIYVYASLAPLFALLSENSLLLTPHTLRPIDDGMRPNERDFLRTGVFNLGFLGLAKCAETDEFLAWWSGRCLRLGFNDVENGYFVDQKWMNLAPCYFEKVHILKNPGCNVAYWNLHERQLGSKDGRWYVVPEVPLLFYHFSGISIDDQHGVSKHTNRSTLESRPDLAELFGRYRDSVRRARDEDPERDTGYAWGSFSNGERINKLCRMIYSLNEDSYCSGDPFDADGEFYKLAKANGLLSKGDTVSQYTVTNANFSDPRLRAIHYAFRAVLKVFGADKYTLLSKYLSYISILRNQGILFGDLKGRAKEAPQRTPSTALAKRGREG